MYSKYMDIKPEVAAALIEGRPVVALESTIISHGMPFPKNVEMALHTESIIRNEGAIPATIAIMNGKIKIGLTDEDLNTLATAKNVTKVSRRDFAGVIASKTMGATTVATTMICAAMAGIRFFVTGGIGGVHRGFEETMDVSADLEELATTNVTVICAGAKAILDLPRTMEYLETKGVPVYGYKTDDLPAFYTRNSGIALRHRADTVEEIADVVFVKEELGLKGGLLVVNPIPEDASMDADYINNIINQSVANSVKDNIAGKDLTPYLLKDIVAKTEGASLEANIRLVYNNALVGAQIARAYSLHEK